MSDNHLCRSIVDAVIEGHHECIRILHQNGENVDKRFLDVTPLHLAADRGKIECAKVLLEYGADIEARDKDGYTPLHRAVFDGRSIKFIQMLLDHCADIEAINIDGNTPLDIATTQGVQIFLREYFVMPIKEPEQK